MSPYELRVYRTLLEIERARPTSQRVLARQVGLALGSTNLLLCRLIKKGWVRAATEPRGKRRYVLTAAGSRAVTQLSRLYFEDAIRAHEEARGRILRALQAVSAEWPLSLAGHLGTGGQSLRKGIVFYEAGRVAEIGYLCLAETDLELVGVIDDEREGRFFGWPIRRSEDLSGTTLDGQPFGRLIVMSFTGVDDKVARLVGRGIARTCVRVV